jgi:hypothetical protein
VIEQETDRPVREPSKKVAESGKFVYVAGAVALTEPGPASVGMAVTDARGRLIAHRAQYLGRATRHEALAQAMLNAARYALANAMDEPVFRLDDRHFGDALVDGQPLPGKSEPLTVPLREALAVLPGHKVELISAAANQARQVALTPLVDWLPERTRRAETLQVTPMEDHQYEVSSGRHPDTKYLVTLRPVGVPGEGEPVSCQCADFTHRGIPCKHLLAVAREIGAMERVFYSEPADTTHAA